MPNLPLVEITSPETLPGPATWAKGLLWCLGHLEILGLAKLRYSNDIPNFRLLELPRGNQACLVRVNSEAHVLIDPWDFSNPTASYLAGRIADLKVNCILKIQRKHVDCFSACPGSPPVIPWTMFHRSQRDWIQNQPSYRESYSNTIKQFRLGCTGRSWSHRRNWEEAVRKTSGTFSHFYARLSDDSTHEYLQKVNCWESALCLVGKTDSSSDGKNRREVEFASIGCPMILNYQPNYLNPMRPDEHYLFAASPEDLPELLDALSLKKRRELADNAFHWWETNASLPGVCRTFIQAITLAGIL